MDRKFTPRRVISLLALPFLIGPLASTSSAGIAGQAQGQASPPAVPSEIIVGLEEGVSQAKRSQILASVGATQVQELDEIDAAVARVPPELVEEIIKRLEANPRVRYAEPNFLLFADDHPVGSDSPNDPSFHELWGLHNFGQTVNGISGTPDVDVDALEAWGVTKGSGSVVVGVIDSGVDFGHPDLGGSMETSPLMWINAGEDCGGCRTDRLDNDLNGYVDDWRGWDFVNNDNNPFDDHGHGTHVTGTIGAVGNDGTGVVGVNWTVKIMALKFLNASGSGTTANAVKAVLYASAMGAHITNNSWGGGAFSQALLDAIRQADAAGSLFVGAAGNGGSDGVGDNNDTTPHYPDGYDVPNVVSVAATNSSDERTPFSNYGQKTVDLGAPGANVYSTWPGNTYRYANGTSMATPHVAGAAALAKAAFPLASDLGLKALLLRSVDPNASLSGRTTTDGRLNVNNAVRCSATPQVWIESPGPGFLIGAGDALTVKVIGANCASATGVAVSATGNGSPITLTPRGDGLWEGTYTPTAVGAVTITASATVDAVTDARTVSGTAVQNYRSEDAPLAWIDATAGGTKTGITGDDSSVTVSLPFSFSFYGQSFTSVKISSNGFLVFGSSAATAWANVAIPNAPAPNGYVGPFWDDLSPQLGGGVWYRTIGAAPSRKFVAMWSSTPMYPGIGSATFEVVLEEVTNDILFQYQDVNFGDARYDYGASATIGVENLNGTLGKQFSYNQAALQPYENAKAIRFTLSSPAAPPDAPSGLTASPTSGSSSKIDLSWADVATETGYRIERSPDGTSWAQVGTTGQNSTAFSDTGLAPSTAYHYRVIATNGAGESAPSNVASATTNPSPPDPPTGLTATAVSASQINLSWADVATETGYRIERSPDGTSWAQVGTTGQNATAFSDTGLAPSTAYHYRVIATNSGGDSGPSNVASATTNAAPIQSKSYAPSSVTILKGESLGDPVSNLVSDDEMYYRVKAKVQASKYVVRWYGQATIDVTGVTKLTLTYDGSFTSTVTQSLDVYNFSTGAWELISPATSVLAADQTFSWSTTTPAPYISAGQQIRMRVHATNGTRYTCNGDLMRFTVEF